MPEGEAWSVTRRGDFLTQTRPMRFAKRLEKAIIDSGKSMKQIAQELGVSASHLSDLKNGKKAPRPSMYRRLADYFGFDVTELLFDESPVTQAPTVPVMAQRAADAVAHMVNEVNELDAEAKRLRSEIDGLKLDRDRLREERDVLRREIATRRRARGHPR